MSLEKRIEKALRAFCFPTHKLHIILCLGPAREQTGPVVKTPQYCGKFKKGRVLGMQKITDSQQIPFTLKVVDKKGQPAQIDGTPEFLVDNSELLALNINEDGMSGDLLAVGPIGSGTFSFKVDADIGDGVQELAGSEEIEVTSGAAVQINVEFGAPVEQT